MRKLLVAAVLALGTMMALASGAVAGQGQEVCSGLDSGKIDVVGDVGTITVTAPDGFLIDEYCVKAGSDVSVPEGAVVYVTVDPPAESVTFGHPSGKDISHYSVGYTEETTPSPTPEPSEPPEPTEPPEPSETPGDDWTPSWTPSDDGQAPIGTSPRNTLATTGADVTVPLIAAGALTGAGLGALWYARRRSS